MAHVASCPQCNHDLLVPDDTDRQSWAKCPQCRAFFQVNQAVLRELPALLLVESHSPVADSKSSAGEVAPLDVPKDRADQAPESIATPAGTTETVCERPQSNEGLQSTAERIDEWFRSAKTVPDAPPNFASEPVTDAGADTVISSDTELESPTGLPRSEAPWDDPHHMEQLLADIETPPADKPTDGDEPPTAHAHRGSFGETSAATSVADRPVVANRASRKPRRKRSFVGTLIVTAAAGIVGSAVGYYALLWLRGPSGDFLDVAQYLPNAMLPAELQSKPQSPPAAAPMAAELQDKEAEAVTATPAKDPVASAEVQATYTTTDEPAAARSQTGDDRYGLAATNSQPIEGPAPLAEPAAGPLTDNATPAEAAQVANAPSFTADELAAALQAAKEAQPSLVAGELDDGREVQRAKGYSYSLLADLAQKATFVDVSSGSESIAASQQAAEELFRQTLSDAHTRGEVALIVPKWIASPHRKQGGVFFAANVVNPQQAGTVVECSAALDTAQSLTLLVPPALADRLEDSSRPLGIIGWIIDEPVEQVNGYTGRAQQAVWVGKLIPLE